jgi:hypothetical protein
MHRWILIFSLLLMAVLAGGCSDDNSSAPPTNQAHPSNWVSAHPGPANSDLSSCQTCHGLNFQGSGDAVSCFSCHSYETAPPFTTHPPSWTDPYIDHRSYAATNGSSSCALSACHGTNLKGGTTGPSCFSASFTTSDGEVLACHPNGPGTAPHPIDASYLAGSEHGPDAKANLTVCQGCHGQPGGPGSNPRFNLGIPAAGNQGCEGCHGVNYAHPPEWAGPNPTFHYNAGSIQQACTLCHGVNLDGVGGVGVSCLGCHSSTTTFTLDCTFCHGYAPDGSPDMAAPMGVNHRGAANVSLHDQCLVCHGVKQSSTGGTFSASSEYKLFDPTTSTNGNHWDGQINMNADTTYNQTNFGCDTAGCHGNDPAHELSDSGLPVELGNYGRGAAPHPLDGTFFAPSAHGPAAKADLTFCQGCHGQPGGAGTNPRFNIGIIRGGDNGCEDCHNDRTAHPSVGTRDMTHWYGAPYTHADAGNMPAACELCHGANLEGPADTPPGVGPACTDCHPVVPVGADASGCVSCHNTPPNGLPPVGNVRPNRAGQHGAGGHALDCSTCHSNGGFGTAAHFDFTPPADVTPPAGESIIFTSNATNTTCNGSCHGMTHTNFTWY